MATEQTATPSRRTLRVGLPLVLMLFVAAGVVSYFGIRPASGQRQPPGSSAQDQGANSPRSPVVSIVLPYDEPDLPPGPHREQFQIACTTCHSTRLVLTQPPFAKAKWGEVVKKMVDVYGAPLNADDQARAVDYLAAIRGSP
jgi:hypothetical protein